jgi:hypothetical protein
MTRLILCFADKDHPQLYRTAFEESSLGVSVQSVRGRTAGAFSGAGTFHWTPAVAALCLLILRHAASKSSDCPAVLEGEGASPAASLDYALSKEPGWLMDMFSGDLQGRPYAKRIIFRSNSQRKRSGPVSLSINSRFLPVSSVEVFLDGEVLKDAFSLFDLAKQIEERWTPQYRRERISASPASGLRQTQVERMEQGADGAFSGKLAKLFAEEAKRALRRTNVFDRTYTRGKQALINNNASFLQLVGKAAPLVHEMDDKLDTSARLGTVEDERTLRQALAGDKPLRCALPFSNAGSMVIFTYLKQVKGYNLEINCRYAHAVEIGARIVIDDFEIAPDICTLGIAPAASVISSRRYADYKPVMFMPEVRNCIVAPKKRTKKRLSLNNSHYVFMRERPSAPLFYFEDLIRNDLIASRRVSTRHAEPDEAISYLAEQDENTRAILFFPHFCINELYNNCVASPVALTNEIHNQFFLFAHGALLADQRKLRYLDIAIRDAWMELSTNDEALQQCVSAIWNDSEYLKLFARLAGMHNLSRCGTGEVLPTRL